MGVQVPPPTPDRRASNHDSPLGEGHSAPERCRGGSVSQGPRQVEPTMTPYEFNELPLMLLHVRLFALLALIAQRRSASTLRRENALRSPPTSYSTKSSPSEPRQYFAMCCPRCGNHNQAPVTGPGTFGRGVFRHENWWPAIDDTRAETIFGLCCEEVVHQWLLRLPTRS